MALAVSTNRRKRASCVASVVTEYPARCLPTRAPVPRPAPGFPGQAWGAFWVHHGTAKCPQSALGPGGYARRHRVSTCLPPVFSKGEPCLMAPGSERSYGEQVGCQTQHGAGAIASTPLTTRHNSRRGPPSSAL